MKRRTKEEEKIYKRVYRARVLPVVPPKEDVPPCPTVSVPPVLPCQGCLDRDMANKILRGKVLMLEKQVELMKRDIPKKEGSVYKFGPEWQRRA